MSAFMTECRGHHPTCIWKELYLMNSEGRSKIACHINKVVFMVKFNHGM